MQNDYDRIFKEEYLPLIAKIFTGLDYSNTQVLKDKIQVTPTLEREGDDFRLVLDKDGLPIYGFQLEIHVTDEDLRGRGQLHHARQLHVLSKLRKLQPIVKKELDNMPTQLFSIKDDLFFQKGVEQGIEIKRDRDVKNMLLKGFTPEVVADVLEVDLQHVLKIQKEIQDNIKPQKDIPQP